MTIFPALLMLHLVALVLMAGTTLIDFVNYQTFWKLFAQQKEQSAGVLAATVKFRRLIGMGAGLLVLSGIGMIALAHGAPAQQLWFKIKLVFVLLLAVNNNYNGGRLGVKLAKTIEANASGGAAEAWSLKGRLRTFHVLQLGIFLMIIFLSAYKFN